MIAKGLGIPSKSPPYYQKSDLYHEWVLLFAWFPSNSPLKNGIIIVLQSSNESVFMAAYQTETVLTVHHWNDTLFSFTTTRNKGLRFRSGHFLMIGLAICRGLTFSSEQTSLGTWTHSLTSSRLGRLTTSLVQTFSGLSSQTSFGTEVTNWKKQILQNHPFQIYLK